MRLEVPAASISPEINCFISTHSVLLCQQSLLRIALWLAVETLFAANPTEEKSLAVVCGRISRPSDLDRHPTHGVHHCRVRYHLSSRDSSSGCVNSPVAAPQLEDLAHDTESNFRRCHGSKLQAGRTLDALYQLWLYALVAQILEDRGGPSATGDQPNITGTGIDDRRKCLFVVRPLRCYHHAATRTYPGSDSLQVRIERFRIWKALPGRRGVADADGEIHQGAKPCQSLGHRCLANDEQFRPRQKRLNEDFQRSLTGARHHEVIDALLGHSTVLEFRADAQQPRLAVRQGLEGLLNHRGLRTTTPHPACQCAIGSDEGLGPRVGRGRSLAHHHRGECKRLALSAQSAGLFEERIPHTKPIPFYAVT